MRRILEKLDKNEIEKIRKSNLPIMICLSLIVSLALIPLIKENSQMKETIKIGQYAMKNYEETNYE